MKKIGGYDPGDPGKLNAEDKQTYVRELAVAIAQWSASWKAVLRGDGLVSDGLAGLTVAAVALPLNVALAVASGLPPVAGLVAGAIGGGVAACFGGARYQVTGPAAALNVMVLAIATDFGIKGVAAAALIVGLVQLVMAFSLAGKLSKFVPEAVLAGFTTGVGIKLLDQQIPELLGFPEVLDYKLTDLALVMHRPHWLHDVSWLSVVCGLGVAFLTVASAKYKRFPAALAGIAVVTFLAVYLKWDIERVGAVPNALPRPSLPDLPDEKLGDLLARALPLGLLAGIESLLAARAVDRMRPNEEPHNPNMELFGQGLGNLAAGMFGGMPVSGVIVRSGVNVQSGARTRLSSILHAAFLLLAILYLSKTIATIPLAALAGLLCVVAVRLIEIGTFVHLLKESRIAALAFLVTAAGTVTGHLISGLVGGFVLMAIDHFLRDEKPADGMENTRRGEGIRAVVEREKSEHQRPVGYAPPADHGVWASQIRDRGQRARSAYVHPAATVIGRVVLGENVHVAAGSSIRADEGAPFFIGADTNLQDGVVLHALKEKWVDVGGERWAIYIGKRCSVAHDALVHGPCFIGDDTFVGFKAVVHDSVVGAHCSVGIGAVVVGVEIPDGKFVPAGTIVDSAEKVAALPDATESHHEFNHDVVGVNRGLAAAYHEDDRRPRTGGRAVLGASAARGRGRGNVAPWEQAWVPPKGARF
jgi:SulP family sulfate permease